MKKSRVWQAIVPGKQKKPQDTLQIRKTPWHGVTKQPPTAPVPGPNVNRMKKSRVWPALPLFQAQKPSHKTPFKSGKHPGMARRNSLLPSLCVTPEPNEKINQGPGRQLFQAHKPSHKTPFKSGRGVTKQPPAVPLPGQTSLLNRMKKSRVWQAIVPGTQTKPQDTRRIRKTPWHGVTKQPPAVPLPPNATPERNEKIKVLAGNCSRHTNQATRHPSNQENTLARRDETASCRPSARPNVTPEPNEKIKGLAGNCSRHTKQATRHPSNQENTLARRDETASCRPSARAKGSGRQLFQAHKTSHVKQPPAVPLPGPNVTPEPNEKIKGLAGNCSRQTKKATRHPSNQENTLARRDETASCRPCARAKRHS